MTTTYTLDYLDRITLTFALEDKLTSYLERRNQYVARALQYEPRARESDELTPHEQYLVIAAAVARDIVEAADLLARISNNGDGTRIQGLGIDERLPTF